MTRSALKAAGQIQWPWTVLQYWLHQHTCPPLLLLQTMPFMPITHPSQPVPSCDATIQVWSQGHDGDHARDKNFYSFTACFSCFITWPEITWQFVQSCHIGLHLNIAICAPHICWLCGTEVREVCMVSAANLMKLSVWDMYPSMTLSSDSWQQLELLQDWRNHGWE